MKDKFSHSPTKDMSSEMLNLFADLMKVGKHMSWNCSVIYELELFCNV